MAITLNKQISLAFNTDNIIHQWIWGFNELYTLTYNDLCQNTLFIIKQISVRLDWTWYILNSWLIQYAIEESENRPDFDNYQYENLTILNNFVRFIIRQGLVNKEDKIRDTVCINNIDEWMETFKLYRSRVSSIINRTISRIHIPSRSTSIVINLVENT